MPTKRPSTAAIRGVGIVQTADVLVADALATRKLEIILKDWSAEGTPMSIVYPAAQRGSTKVRVFADFAAGTAAARCASTWTTYWPRNDGVGGRPRAENPPGC